MKDSPGSHYAGIWSDPESMVSWHDGSGVYRAASPGAKNVIGWPHDEIEGQDPYPLLHPDDIGVIAAYHERLWTLEFEGEAVRFRIRDAKGKYRWIETKTKRGQHPEWGSVSVSVSRPVERQPEASVVADDGRLLHLPDLQRDSVA